jgi:CheY-like chemotaxis protein
MADKDLSNKKILLVEDHPQLIEMYKLSFKLHSPIKNVYVAEDKESALKMIREIKPDLVILDILIPPAPGKSYQPLEEKYGLDYIEEIRKDPELKDTKIVVLTNFEGLKERAQAKKLGVLDYLIKIDYLPKDLVKKTLEYL